MRRVVAFIVCAWCASVSFAQEADGNPARTQALQSYRSFLDLAPRDDPRRPSALRRTADLELEEAERLMVAGSNPAAATDYCTRAIGHYRELLSQYPDQPDNDGALYQLARALEQNGDEEAALATMAELVRRFPSSPHGAESDFRRGETLFSRGELPAAEQAYGAVLALGPDTIFYEQALYKQGWSQFRQSHYEDGLTTFFTLLDRKLAGQTDGMDPLAGLARADRELVDDTLRAISISFSYLGGTEAATSFLDTRPVRYEDVVFQRLGDLYMSQERYNDAAETYRAFVARQPAHARAPFLQLAVIDTYQKAGFADEVLTAKVQFVEDYALDRPYWATRTPADAPEVAAQLKLHLTELAQYFHARAQTDHEAADYEQAIRWYRAWLESFPQEPEAADTRFLLAEILFERERYDEAAAEYERVAYDYGAHSHAAESGYAALLAYAKQEVRLPEGARAPWHRKSIDASLRFASAFPAHPQAPVMQTRAAKELFDLGEDEAAIAAAERLVAWDPTPGLEELRTGWVVLGHAHFDRGEYASAEQAYGEALALLDPNEKLAQEIREKRAAAVYEQGSQQAAAGDLNGAVAMYLRVAEIAPGSPIRATAEYDAAAALLDMKDYAQATTVLQQFRAAHPGHELQGEVTRKLAAAYLESGHSVEAAHELDAIARDQATDAQMRHDAALQAATLYEGAHDTAGAIAAYEYFIATFPQPLDPAIDAREHLATLHTERGDTALAQQALRGIVDADAAAGGARTDVSRTAAAKASLALADVGFAPFQDMRLVTPLKKSLAQKKSAMEQLLNDYGHAADYGITEVTTAATYRIAELYAELAHALNESERPADLSQEELDQYEMLLEEQAFPFEEKAVEVHEANARRTAEGVYDHWVQESFARLAELVPGRYAKTERIESFVSVLE
jgi:tetratricopeptide (TPR) repeat protein